MLGNCFSLDHRTTNAICKLDCAFGGVSLAVAYVTIAQGTWKGGRFSKWSAASIEKHTGLSFHRAQAAIRQLIEWGFLRLADDSTQRKPRYEVLPYCEVYRHIQATKLDRLTSKEKRWLGQIRDAGASGLIPKTKIDNALRSLRRLVHDGFIRQEGERYLVVPTPDPAEELLWFPNEIVQGTSAGEPSPLKLLRARNDPWTLWLFLTLYKAQILAADGGISRKVLYRKYERKRWGQKGRHIIWGFVDTQTRTVNPVCGITAHHWSRSQIRGEDAIWDSIKALESLGLLYCVPHLVEHEGADAEIIHALGGGEEAERMEDELGEAAQIAANLMLAEKLDGVPEKHGVDHLVPVYDNLPDIQVMGIFRLRYRPATSLTAKWYQKLRRTHDDYVPVYRRLAGDTEEEINAEAVQNKKFDGLRIKTGTVN
jgi:hypothetical protein